MFPAPVVRPVVRPVGLFGFPIRVAFVSSALIAAGFLLSGCGATLPESAVSSQAGVRLQGNVHGGQQAVVGATIQLYAAQATGYGAASAPLIGSTVMTDGNGDFTITGDYQCPASPNDQVYLVATQGNPGGGTNANLALMSAIGPCSTLSSSEFIVVNEVSTVAAAYSLAGFMTDYKHVGASPTNYLGLEHAFATVGNLIDKLSAQAYSVTPAYANPQAGTTAATFSSKVPQAEINTLGNILAACVNTNGVGGSSQNCANLFAAATPPNGTAPTDTATAALYIAQNPANNVQPLFMLASAAGAPFSPTIGTQPNDWSMALNFIGGGLGGTNIKNDAQAEDMAIDGSGNIWITDQNSRRNSVTELNFLGAPLSPTTTTTPAVNGGFTGGGLNQAEAIAIDTLGNAWLANTGGSLSEFTSAGVPVGTGFTGGGLGTSTTSLAIDGQNHIFAISQTAVAEFDNSGNPLSGPNGYTAEIAEPVSISIDGAGNLYVVNGGNGNLVKMSNSGVFLSASGDVVSSPTSWSALDASGQLWVPLGTGTDQLQVYVPNVTSYQYYLIASVLGPNGIAIDGRNHVWVANAGGSCGPDCVTPTNITELSDAANPISPAQTGYTGVGSNLLEDPQTLRIDNSGNVWVLNSISASSVTEFVGIASPTITPQALAVKNNAIATLP